MFMTATIQRTVSGLPTHGDSSCAPTNGNVKRSTQMPEATGIGGGADLPGELLPPEEPAEVVDRADGRRDGGAEQQAAHLVRELDERERRDDDPEEEREPAELRDDPLVDASLARAVDDAEVARDVADDGRQQHDDEEREAGAVEDLRVRAKLVEHVRATSSRTGGRLRRRGRAR